MKKSEIYHQAQIAVMMHTTINVEKRLEVLRVLMDAEDSAKLIDDWDEKEAKEHESV